MYQLLSALLNPFVAFLLLLGVAIVLSRIRATERWRRLVILLYGGVVLSSMPLTSYLLMRPLEAGISPLRQRTADAEAIVVLAGGAWRSSSSPRGVELKDSTLARCIEAARLYHDGPPCKVYASGGPISGPGEPRTHAAEMRHLLIQLGVSERDIVVEDESTTTYENAVETSKLLAKEGIGRIILVTDAAHLLRAGRCFEARGIRVTPAGARYRTSDFRLTMQSFLPSAGGIGGVEYACHEWLGLAWYWLHGRI